MKESIARKVDSVHIKMYVVTTPANMASPPDLAIRRRKCDGGGYIVPL